MPNNRQLAVLVLLGTAAVCMLFNKGLRSSLYSIVRAFLNPKLAISVTLMCAWVGAEIVVARRTSLWNLNLVTSTIFWFFGSAFVLFINTPNSAVEHHFFRNNLVKVVKLSVFLGFFMNLFVLNLPAELVLQIALFFLIALSVVAGSKTEFNQVKKFADALVGFTIIGLAAYEVVEMVNQWHALNGSGLVKQFFLPLWLTLGLLPFIYLVGVCSEYGLAFLRTEWTTGRRWGRRFALVTSFGLQSHKLHSFIGDSAYRVSNTSSFTDTRRAIHASQSRDDSDEDGEDPPLT